MKKTGWSVLLGLAVVLAAWLCLRPSAPGPLPDSIRAALPAGWSGASVPAPANGAGPATRPASGGVNALPLRPQPGEQAADLLPGLLAASGRGDLDAMAQAGMVLGECYQELSGQLMYEQRRELGERWHQPSFRLRPLVKELGQRVGNQPLPARAWSRCVGVGLLDLREAPELLLRAAAAGNVHAKYELGRRWYFYFGIAEGMVADHHEFGLPRLLEPLLAKFPEAARMRDLAQRYLVEAAHAGHLGAVAEVAGSYSIAANAEQAYFWDQVLAALHPDWSGGRHHVEQRRLEELRGRPAPPLSGRSLPEMPDTGDPLRDVDYGLSPERAAAIRDAAGALARRCCRAG